ncbi:MAG: hypothetical protein QGI09_02930, partial [Dehalococcoidia bacterium]|nr:hypothetical protein [Dehalococcoidia bacterium]
MGTGSEICLGFASYDQRVRRSGVRIAGPCGDLLELVAFGAVGRELPPIDTARVQTQCHHLTPLAADKWGVGGSVAEENQNRPRVGLMPVGPIGTAEAAQSGELLAVVLARM